MNYVSQLITTPWSVYKQYKHARHTERCRLLLAALYRDVDAFDISIRHRKQENIEDSQFTYGEIVYASFIELLAIVQPKKDEIFFDLGCGGGKAVFTTALLYPDVHVRGVEFIPPLFELCKTLQRDLSKRMQADKYFSRKALSVEFSLGDLLSVDFSTINIVYLNVTCFDNQLWSQIENKLELLPVNARVIIVSKHLSSPHFEMICSQSHLMSWGLNTINIYRKQ